MTYNYIIYVIVILFLVYVYFKLTKKRETEKMTQEKEKHISNPDLSVKEEEVKKELEDNSCVNQLFLYLPPNKYTENRLWVEWFTSHLR